MDPDNSAIEVWGGCRSRVEEVNGCINKTSGVLWVELCPQKRYAEILTYGTYGCDPTWKWDICRCNQHKMR